MSKIINAFPGYQFVSAIDSEDGQKHNMYKGMDMGFGGLVYSEPGMYSNVKVFDSASHHPHSIIAMNCFGEYTQRYKDLLDLRVAIKHKDYDTAKKMLNGSVSQFLTDENQAKQIAQAAKIVLNSTYGQTAANYENPFRDPRNINNIVALRGALFMWDLKEQIEKIGCQVISIKTDSIKVVNPPKNMLAIINKKAENYGYEFELENSFEKICLVNDAVFIAKCADDDPEWIEKCKKAEQDGKPEPTKWTATGTQFAVPYVFKTLFSHEPLAFDDYCETKSVVKGELYLDMNENLAEDDHNYQYIGRVGQFCPIKKGCGGGILYRKQDEKYYAATGTKGYRWLESEMVKGLGKENDIDDRYYRRLVDEAVASINEFGDFEWFVND